MLPRIDRRRFLIATSAAPLAAAWGGAGSLARAMDDTAVRLEPSESDLFRVRMEMTLEGNVDLAKNPLVSKQRDRQIPIQANAVIDFEERLVRDAQGTPAAAYRYYFEAQSHSTVAGQETSRQLRDDARRVSARLVEGPVVLYGEREFLTHEELELLQLPVCSVAIDSLLPTEKVRAGDTWTLAPERLARVFNLAAVQKSTVTGEVVSIDAKDAKMQLQGRVDGSIDGVPTALDIAAKVTFDRQAQAITWLALAVREVREIGKAKPGFEISATIKLVRQPHTTPKAVQPGEPIDLSAPVPGKFLVVQIDSQAGKFSGFLDRQWRVLADSPGLTRLRMTANDDAIAQCDIRELSPLKAGSQLTLEAFQSEIRRSLDKRFSEFLEAEEGLNAAGLRTLRVAVLGAVEGVPVQWVFLHFSDDSGRRLAATFTLEASKVEAFGGSDAQLANSLQFAPGPEATEPVTEQAAGEPVTRG